MFSKEDAVAAGWSFVHAQDESVEVIGDGLARTTPGLYRAEKYVQGKLVSQVAHSEDALVAVIEDYEAHLALRDPDSAGASVSVGEGM